MEFPPEILAIIRAYSMPRSKYFREYNRFVRSYSRFVEAKYVWPALREMIDSSFLPLLAKFDRVFLEWVEAKKAFRQWNYTMPFGMYQTLQLDCFQAKCSIIEVERELQHHVKVQYLRRLPSGCVT